MFCDKITTGDVKQNGSFIVDARLERLDLRYKVFYYVITGRLIKQASKKCFWTEKMILRNITWIHSLIQIEAIKRCSIHVFRYLLIIILYNIIIFTYSNIIFPYSNIHCVITLICLIILISHIVKLLLIRKFYCFRPGAHISFKYARHNHLRCLMLAEVSPQT